MNFFNLLLLFFSQSLLSITLFAQSDSIFENNVWRSYIVHLPNNYNSNNQYPLVINIHGLNSNALQQQTYSQFNKVADNKNFIVVYPNANSGSWAINGTSDVGFISHLIDTVRNKFSCNNCLFLTGMSQGGFLTYKLACSLSQTINAIAVVSGNISQNLQNTCAFSKEIPLIHFHGTADSLVKYNGSIGIPPVTSTIDWLINQNNCETNPIYNEIPNTVISDSSVVEKFQYSGSSNNSEIVFYKILNGGHTWPGSSSSTPFGNTNQDINASQIIGDFFGNYCKNSANISENHALNTRVYPNPFRDNLFFENIKDFESFDLFNQLGQIVCFGNINEKLHLSHLNEGMYILKLITEKGNQTLKLIKE